MNLFTVSKIRYPKHLESTFKNYTFYFDNDKTYQLFFQQNIINDISCNEIIKINNSFIKKICFIFYILYLKGGFFIDLNIIPSEQIYTYQLKPNTFYCVKSMLNNSLFNGVFGSHKENRLLLTFINQLIQLDKQNINFLNNNLYELIQQNINYVFLFKEEKILSDCVSILTNINEELFIHYYNPKVSYTIPFIHNSIDKPSDIKIGITLILFNDIKSFFANGINQNSLYLCELLLNIGFDVYFIVQDHKLIEINPEILNDIMYDKRFKFNKYSEILYSEYNVIFTLSFSYGEMFIYNYLKHMKTKHIGYFCGNTYIIESEKILYNQHKSIQNNEYEFTVNGLPKYDQIWSIPQMTDINLDFWKILYKCPCISVPFVWSNNSIKLFCKANLCTEEELYYINKGVEKKIAIFEPNISIMKWCLPSILICDYTYRNNKYLKHLYITNINSPSTNDFNLKQFNKLLKTLDIVKDKKCSIEKRYTTLYFMKNYADIAVSHQWGNPLNYLYLDLAWMGWPIIHNAELCKDIGYYYHNYNLLDGSTMLDQVIQNHDKNINEYIQQNRNAIQRFLPTDFNLQKSYKDLIFNLFRT
jgi:hypothetical protein